MFGLFSHPATEYTCRHCGESAGYDPEMCFRCGPICGKCFMEKIYPCKPKKEGKNAIPKKENHD